MRIQPRPPLRIATRQATSPDAPPHPCAPPTRADGSDAANPVDPPPAETASDLGDLFSTAISAVGFDAPSIERNLAARRRTGKEPIEWRLVAAAAILVILMVAIDLILQLV